MEGEVIESSSKVVLPFNKDQFAGFITSLLGRPQETRQRFAFPFELTSDDVKDTFHLVEQRVHDQNDATLIQFFVDVTYNDGSSVAHSSLEDFLNYKEVKPLIPSSLTMSWTYLITFQNRPAPEKQEIEVAFISHASHFSPEYSYKGIETWFDHAVGMSRLKINHTARSWSNDIESLLSNHIKTYEKHESKYRKWCRKKSGAIALTFFLFILFLGLSALLTTTYLLTENERVAVDTLLNVETQSSMVDKINFIIQHSLLGNWPRYFFSAFLFVVFLIVGGIFGSAAMSNISEYTEPSFILISKNSEKHKDNVLQKLSKTWRRYLGVLGGGVISSVIANIIFTLFWLP